MVKRLDQGHTAGTGALVQSLLYLNPKLGFLPFISAQILDTDLALKAPFYSLGSG